MCVFSVGSFLAQSRGSLMTFLVPLGVGKLSLNGENFLHVWHRYRVLSYLVGSFLAQSRGSLMIFLVPLGVGKLSLNGENFLHVWHSYRVLAYLVGRWRDSISVCTSIHPLEYSDVHLCIFMSISTFVHLSIHWYICQYIHTSASTILNNILTPHSCHIA